MEGCRLDDELSRCEERLLLDPTEGPVDDGCRLALEDDDEDPCEDDPLLEEERVDGDEPLDDELLPEERDEDDELRDELPEEREDENELREEPPDDREDDEPPDLGAAWTTVETSKWQSEKAPKMIARCFSKVICVLRYYKSALN